MHQLNTKTNIIGFDGFDHFFHGRNAFIVPQGGKTRQFEAVRVHTRPAHQDHAHATPGPCCQVSGELLGNMVFLIHAKIDAHGGHEQAVFGGHLSDLNRREKMPENVHESSERSGTHQKKA